MNVKFAIRRHANAYLYIFYNNETAFMIRL